jgi:hypothetical protein
MTAGDCASSAKAFTGTSALTFTLIAPIAGCLVEVQNNTSQPLTIVASASGVTVNGQTSDGVVPACSTPANGCSVVTIKANGTSSWDMGAAVSSGGGGGSLTTAVFVPLGPMGAVDGYTFGIASANGWGLAQDYGGGGNVPLAYNTYNAFWQFSQSITYAIGRWLWIPADYDNTQSVTLTFDFGPDIAGGTGNLGMKASIGCVTPAVTPWTSGFPTQNASATTGPVVLSATQYMHQQATTGVVPMVGCSPGSLAKIIVSRDISVAGNSSTALDLFDGKLNYSRR